MTPTAPAPTYRPERGALSSDRIPIILRIDAEPDGLFIDRERPLPWQGYERSVEYLSNYGTGLRA